MRDIVVTWPKSRTLSSYLNELSRAAREGKLINYRVAQGPKPKPDRCYLVFDGYVIGYNDVIGVSYRRDNEVKRIGEPGFWPAGWYVVRDPVFHSCTRLPMPGFRGWRWFDRRRAGH